MVSDRWKDKDYIREMREVMESMMNYPVYLNASMKFAIRDMLERKQCVRCKRWLPFSAYDKRKTYDGYFKMCIECTDKNRKWKGVG